MKIFQFIRFLKAIVNTIFGRGAILLLPFLPAVASCQHSAFFNAGDPLLLDEIPGATAAFSVRQLSSTYTGSAVEVRRASDGTTQNIGFEGGIIDLGTLTTFCSGTDCFVKTWYDQSGNGKHLSQATTGAQPIIFESGSPIYENGKPAIKLVAASSDILRTSAQVVSDDNFSIYTVFAADSSQNNGQIINQHSSSADVGRTVFVAQSNAAPTAKPYVFFNNGTSYIASHSLTAFDGDIKLVRSQSDGSGNTGLAVNGNFETLITGQTWVPFNTPLNVGALGNGSFAINANIMEIVIYAPNNSANSTAIETNVNNFFSIY